MIRLKFIRRLLHIHRVLARHGLDELILATHLFRPVRFLALLSPGYWRRTQHAPRGVRIRRSLEDLGPIFVKFGQALSTRRDLLAEDIADELAKLQDQVPPFPGEEARRMIENALGQPIAASFKMFDETPLASASIAQVHAAALHDEQEVVVKVLRPGVEQRIRSDVALLHELASLAQRFWPGAKRLRPVEVVAEFEKTILDELDLVREAANAAEIRRHFEASELLYIPRIHWPLTRRQVLVMERIYGIPVSDVERLKRENVDLKLLAERGVEIFFTQVFRDNFFHADMHPGNIFVAPGAQYIAVDFGIVGSLSASDQQYIGESLRAFFSRDYRRVAEMHVASGWVPRETRVEELESAVRSVCEPIFEKPLKEISYGHLLLRLFQVARRFDMEVQPQLVLLQKTLLNIEGLGRELYPDLDLWQTAKPFLEKWFKQRMGPRAAFARLRAELPGLLQQAPELPGLVHQLLHNAVDDHLHLQRRSEELALLRSEMRRQHRRTLLAITGGALIVSAALLFGLNGAPPGAAPGHAPALSGMLGGLGALLLIVSWR